MKASSLPIIETSTACLRFFGENLDPASISAALGVNPTSSANKGDISIGKKTGREYIAKTGKWLLRIPDCNPENLEVQITELLTSLPSDMTIWSDITACYSADIYCGLFMGSSNDNLYLSSKCLLMMGQRGLELAFDIYSPLDDDDPALSG